MKNNNFFLAISECAFYAQEAASRSAWWEGYNLWGEGEWAFDDAQYVKNPYFYTDVPKHTMWDKGKLRGYLEWTARR